MNSEPNRQPPVEIDPKVRRRTLSIVVGAFLLGFVLACFWMTKEILRVSRIQSLPVDRSVLPPSKTAPTNPATPPAKSPKGPAASRGSTNGMVWIPSGTYLRGSESGAPDEQPVRELKVDGFWIDRTEVTNEAFEEFVRQTGYVTVAERPPDPAQYPDVPRDRLVPGSAVFHPPKEVTSLSDFLSWWEYVPGANWKHPEGPNSDLKGREKMPVVHVCWFDAVKYAEWAGKRLPTEAEWEYAARGGLAGAPFTWGNEMMPRGRWQANIWQGEFPVNNRAEDGFPWVAPVGSFPPNGYGLFDMSGNVWEWCSDYYMPDYYASCPTTNPQGPDRSFDPNEPGVPKRVQRGGSFLCSDTYCSGYRPSARMKTSPDTALSHSGFRCVISGPSLASR